MSLIRFVLLLFVQKHYLQKAVAVITLQMITAKLVFSCCCCHFRAACTPNGMLIIIAGAGLFGHG